jgi:hypothetical protein
MIFERSCCLKETMRACVTVQVEVAPSQMAGSSQRPASSGVSDGAASSQKSLPEGKASSQQAPVDVSLTPPGTSPSGAVQSAHLASSHVIRRSASMPQGPRLWHG